MHTRVKWLRICLWAGIFISSASTAFHHYRLSQCNSIAETQVLEDEDQLNSNLIGNSRLHLYDTFISAGLLILFSLGLFLLYSHANANRIQEQNGLIDKIEDLGKD
ncbi:MAG: hypothetical protein R8P61_11990 [Bacteroidia bacterium]|nr:hypothetical protein [Bacteroidia bacterium]